MKRTSNQIFIRTILSSLLILSGIALIAGCSTLTPFGSGGPPESTLANTYWQLTRVANQSVTADKQKRQPYILLTSDKHQFQGFAGCNNIHGTYKHTDKQLRFTTIAQTRMMCRSHMWAEQALVQALGKTRHMRIHDHTLYLMGASGHVLARFDARLKQFEGG